MLSVSLTEQTGGVTISLGFPSDDDDVAAATNEDPRVPPDVNDLNCLTSGFL